MGERGGMLMMMMMMIESRIAVRLVFRLRSWRGSRVLLEWYLVVFLFVAGEMIQEWCERKGIASAQVDFEYLNYNGIYQILHYLEGEFATERTSTAEDFERI